MGYVPCMRCMWLYYYWVYNCIVLGIQLYCTGYTIVLYWVYNFMQLHSQLVFEGWVKVLMCLVCSIIIHSPFSCLSNSVVYKSMSKPMTGFSEVIKGDSKVFTWTTRYVPHAPEGYNTYLVCLFMCTGPSVHFYTIRLRYEEQNRSISRNLTH